MPPLSREEAPPPRRRFVSSPRWVNPRAPQSAVLLSNNDLPLEEGGQNSTTTV